VDLLTQGLVLSLTGITVTFSSLGLFILIIVGLQRIFGGTGQPQAAAPAGNTVTSVPLSAEEAKVAAIAVGLELARSRQQLASALGASLEAGRGAWWHQAGIPTPPGVRPGPNGSQYQ
jgi:Na+-transporting methylmalonyl-CoA/oxaloacetate decarboxylase gamma subunit